MSEHGAIIEVDSLDAVYLLPDDHPAVETVRWRLDRIARTRLEDGFARALGGVLQDADESVWLIRDLDVPVDVVAADEDEDELTSVWAEALANAVAETLARGPDGDGVRRFTSPVEYIAAFVDAAARGHGRDAWFYVSFESLRALPVGAAICEALARDPPAGGAALGVLAARGRLERVLMALNGSEARRLAGALAPGNAVTIASLESVLAVWNVVVPTADGRAATPANVLRLLAAVATTAMPPAEAAGAVRALLALADALREHGVEVRAWLLSDAGEVAAVAGVMGSEEVAALALLAESARRDPALKQRVVETIAADDRIAPRLGSVEATAYGGVFLLLSGLVDLDVDSILAPLLAPETDPASLRLALLARCAGSTAALSDAGVRLAAGAKPGGDAPHTDPSGDARAQRILLERLVRLGRAEGRFLVVEDLETAGRLFVVRDAARDAWLYACEDPERALHVVREVFEREPEHVLDSGAVELAPAGFRQWLDRRCDLREELAALGFGSDVRPDALVLSARAALRELTTRLMGFEWSSAAYLQRNFIFGAGTIRGDGRTFEVELPASPLQVVLQLAGVHGRTMEVPWLGEVRLMLPES